MTFLVPYSVFRYIKFCSSVLTSILFVLTNVIPTQSSYLTFFCGYFMLSVSYICYWFGCYSYCSCWALFSLLSVLNYFFGVYGLNGLCYLRRLISFRDPPLFILVWKPFVLNFSSLPICCCFYGEGSLSSIGLFHNFFYFLYLYECLLYSSWFSFVCLLILYFSSENAGLLVYLLIL